MPRMQILTPAEYAAFETPPVFNSVERKRFFHLSQRLENLLATFRTPTNQICFVLTLGYFKATKRFFPQRFHDSDADYVARQLGCFPGVCDLSPYDEATARRHRKIALDDLGFRPFDAIAKQELIREIRTLVRSQVRPKAMFLHALDTLASRKTEIPGASLFTDLITAEMTRHKGTLTEVIDVQLPPELRTLLDALLEKTERPSHSISQIQRFQLTLLKKISQSTRPSRIKATLEDWQTLRLLYDELAPLIASLDLTHDGIRYYAHLVLQSQIFQVSRRADEERYLHLVCFIAPQCYRVQDTLVDMLLTVVQSALNTAQRAHRDQYYAARLDHRRTVRALVNSVDQGVFNPWQAIEIVVCHSELSDHEKVQRIQEVLTTGSPQRQTAEEQLASFKAQTQHEADEAGYYAALTAQSRKLQSRVAGMVKVVNFQGDDASELMAAIHHDQAKDGQVTQSAPLGFLASEEQKAVVDESGAIRASLYKALLCIKIAEAIKGGALNLRHSYKYRSLDDYLIAKADWQAHRDDYLQRADLTAVADCRLTLNL